MLVKAKPSHAKRPAVRRKAASARTAEPAEEREESRQAKVLEAVLTEVTAAPETPAIDEDAEVECPYCGETFEVHVTSESDGQTMYEDCEVCSRVVSVHVQIEDGEVQVEAYRA